MEETDQLEEPGALRIEKAVYGGDGLARTDTGEVAFVPFALPGELVAKVGNGPATALQILQPSPERVDPACVHFGVCGGCQYQMASYPAQLGMKEAILRETLTRAGVGALPEFQIWGSPEPYGYRNRIRLRVREVDGALRLGYNTRGTKDLLPVRMCPISAPVLWRTAEAVMAAAARLREAAEWLRAAAEVELAADDHQEKVQVHLLCPGPVPQRKGSFEQFVRQVHSEGLPPLSVAASRLHLPSGRATEILASSGAEGIPYRVADDSFWLKPGSFFQVNRFLVPQMVELVCRDRHGQLAWDLFAGVGLFTRRLARQFAAVTAVEANPAAIGELRRVLRRPADAAVEETTLAFLRKARLQRERPELIVLDPPRAGAGEEACALLGQLKPAEIVYVSCDPTTLARDLAVLTNAGYGVAELHMLDLFPQTYHLETVMVLRHAAVRG